MNISPKQFFQFFGGLACLAVGATLIIRTFLIEEFMWFGLGIALAIIGGILLEDLLWKN